MRKFWSGWFSRGREPERVQEPPSLHRRIRRVEVKTSRLVQALLEGSHQSVFKGRGIEFEEVREYQEGDDPRSIDWNVSARMNRLFVKRFVEERERVMMLVIDVSASENFGSNGLLKRELAAELAATLTMGALRSQDRVGLCLFSDRIERYIPPKKGRGHVSRVVREVLGIKPIGRGTRYHVVEKFLLQTVKARCALFFISDFLNDGFERPLRLLAQRHEVIPVCLQDPRESALPDVGVIRLEDPETGTTMLVDTSDPAVRLAYSNASSLHQSERDTAFVRLGLTHLQLQTDQPLLKPLMQFFRTYRGRQSRRVPSSHPRD